MCYPALIVAGASMGMQTLLGMQQNQQTAATAEVNAGIAATKEHDTLVRGDQAVLQQQIKAEQALGAQRAIMGASGTVVNSGSNADILVDTAKAGAMDAATTRSNALKEAWGYEVERINWQNQADSANAAAESQKTLLTAGQNRLPGVLSWTGNPGMALAMRRM